MFVRHIEYTYQDMLPYDYFMMLYVELIIELDKTDKCKPVLIVKDIIEQAKTVLYVYKFAF